MDVVYLRDLDGSGSMHVCAQGDVGAEPYVRDGMFSGVYAVALADQMESRRSAERLRATLRQIADSGNSINAHLAAQALETEHGNG